MEADHYQGEGGRAAAVVGSTGKEINHGNKI